MKLSTILIFMLLGFFIGILLLYVFAKILYKVQRNKNSQRKRFCHRCQLAFLIDEEHPVNYCQACGNELQYMFEIDTPQTEETPFEDFNEKEQ